MPQNIRYESQTTHQTIAAIRAEVELRLGDDAQKKYEELYQGIEKSQGEYIDMLKQQLELEQAAVEDVRVFYMTLLQMMEQASGALDENEAAYTRTGHIRVSRDSKPVT